MSVSELTKQLRVFIKLSLDSIVLKYLKTKRLFGRGHEHNCVHYFDSNQSVARCANASLSIHCFLGHPYLQHLSK